MANPFRTAIGFVLLTWFVIAFLVLAAERSVPEGNIKSVEDALWWGVVTLLTVGYGDKFPDRKCVV